MQRVLISLILTGGCLGTIFADAAEAPRQRTSLDYGWKFTRGDVQGAEAPAFDAAAWQSVDLPHDWSIEGPFSQDEAAGNQGAYLPTGIGWYRKTFSMPDKYKDKRISIEFDGVYQDSEVWINGTSSRQTALRLHQLRLRSDRPSKFGDRTRTSSPSASTTPTRPTPAGTRARASTGMCGCWPQTRYTSLTGALSSPRRRSPRPPPVVQITTHVKNEGKTNVKCIVDTEILDKDGKVVAGSQSPGEHSRRRRARTPSDAAGVNNPTCGPSMRPTCTACGPRSRRKTWS